MIAKVLVLALLVCSAVAVTQRAWISESGESEDFPARPVQELQVVFASDGQAGTAMFQQPSEARLAVKEAEIEALEKREEEALHWQQQALEVVSQQRKAVEVEEKKMEAVMQMQKFLAAKAGQTSNTLHFHMSGLQRVTMSALQLGAAAKGEEETWDLWLIASASYFVLMLLLALVYARFLTYEYERPKKDLRHVDRQYFSFSLLDSLRCDPDARILCVSCCCQPIRWADTASSGELGDVPFWPAVMLMCGLIALSGISYYVSAVVFIVIAVMNRQKIRRVYGMPHGTCSTCTKDCLVWSCCPCCATMQEAMQIEFVFPPNFLNQTWLETPRQQVILDSPYIQRKQKNGCC